MKRSALLIITTTMLLSINTISFAGEWKQDEVGYWYQNDDGTFPSNQWFQDFDGKWYFLNESGYKLINGTAPDGRAVGSDGVWVQPVTGDRETILYQINNWIIGDIWNDGYCNFYHFEEDGKDSAGQSIDIDYALERFKEAYKKKAGYETYINSLPEEYASLKTAWSKLSVESDKLYKYFEAGVNQTRTSVDTGIFVQYRDAFSDYVYDLR